MEDLPPPLFKAVQCSVSWVRAFVTTCCLVGHSWQGQGTCDCLSGGAQLTGSGVRALVTTCCLVGHSWQGQGSGHLWLLVVWWGTADRVIVWWGTADSQGSGHLWLLVVWWGTADRVRGQGIVTTGCLVGHSWQGQGSGHLWLLVVWWGTADRVRGQLNCFALWFCGGKLVSGVVVKKREGGGKRAKNGAFRKRNRRWRC